MDFGDNAACHRNFWLSVSRGASGAGTNSYLDVDLRDQTWTAPASPVHDPVSAEPLIKAIVNSVPKTKSSDDVTFDDVWGWYAASGNGASVNLTKDINRIVYSITGSSKDIPAKKDEGVTVFALGGQGDSLKISGSNAGLVMAGGANDNVLVWEHAA